MLISLFLIILYLTIGFTFFRLAVYFGKKIFRFHKLLVYLKRSILRIRYRFIK